MDATRAHHRTASPPQEALPQSIRRALGAGDWETVRAWLENGADVNASDEHRQTVLMHALRTDHRDDVGPMVQGVLQRGADVRAADQYGWTALHWACAQSACTPEVVRALVEAGADLNACDSKGQTPAIVAASRNHSARLRVLVEAGADVAHADAAGVTALIGAARGHSPSVVALLLATGADVNAVCARGTTALMQAAATARTDNIRVLLAAGADWTVRDHAGQTAEEHCLMVEVRRILGAVREKSVLAHAATSLENGAPGPGRRM